MGRDEPDRKRERKSHDEVFSTGPVLRFKFHESGSALVEENTCPALAGVCVSEESHVQGLIAVDICP